MKQIIYILAFLFMWQHVSAQTLTENHIVTKTFTKDDNNTAITQIQYFDGLGRPVETVMKAFTPAGKDFVSTIIYDNMGRESQNWLPAASENNDGSFVNVETFKNTQKVAYGNDAYPYNEVKYEASPLNRVIEQYGAGADWRTGQGKKVSSSYETNIENEVALFYVANGNALARYNYYDPNSLYKTVVIDEDNKKTVEFTDIQGRVVMKQSFDGSDKHNTHYVYNDLNQLCYVISPEAANVLENMSGSATPEMNSTDPYNKTLFDFCYCYQYDEHGNCIYKKLPGCTPIFMIYDKADRLILSQDGNQRKKIVNGGMQWTVTKYDKLGRVIFTGLQYRTENDSTNLYSSIRNWTKDDLIVEDYISGAYTNTKFTDATPLTVNYYDDYNFIAKYSLGVQNLLNYMVSTDFDKAYPTDKTLSTELSAKGLLTGSVTYLLDGSSNYTIRTNFYDYRGLVVQTRTTNLIEGYDYDFFHYNFTGNVVKHRHVHKTSYIASDFTEDYKFTYDNSQRLDTIKHIIDKRWTFILSTNIYDELCRLNSKTLNGGGEIINYTYNIRNWLKTINSPRFSQTMYYQDALDGKPAYFNGNISAIKWGENNVQNEKYYYTYDGLNRMKKAQYAPNELFNEEITNYDKNGNIKGIKRNGYIHDIDTEWPVYPGPIDDIGFEYNGNQLKNAWENLYDQDLTVVANNDFRDVYADNISTRYLYDANGNQYADFNKGIAWIKYNSLNLPEKIQFSNGNKAEYFYDASGVKYKAQWGYAVNTQNIPLGAFNTENNSLSGVTRTEYCGNYVYENGVLRRIITPEGFVSANNNLSNTYMGVSWYYRYFLKDHLGNTRRTLSVRLGSTSTALTASTGIIDYYPFGMEVTDVSNPGGENYSPGYTANPVFAPYLYNGKEIDRMHGLNMYDYGARMYDAAIGRWHGVDPLAEKYLSMSTYVYCLNNPVRFVDPNGCEIDLSQMSDEEKKRFESNIKNQRENSDLFNAMYNSLEQSDEVYVVKFGQTTSENGTDPVKGQFKKNEEGGGTITFLSGEDNIQGSVISEEFFHAFQSDNSNNYKKGEFNFEFEAKVFATAVGISYGGVGEYLGMGEFQTQIILGNYGDNQQVITTENIISTTFLNNYTTSANSYANFNRVNNFGNSHYKKNTTVEPYSLQKIVSITYNKK